VTSPLDGAEAADPVVIRSAPPSWKTRRFAHVLPAVVAFLWVTLLIWRPDVNPISLIGFAYPTALALMLPLQLRGYRLELLRDGLVLRAPLRVRRVPYRDITAVTGDVPTRIEWSTTLVLQRRSGRPLTLPQLALPLPELRDLIAARLGSPPSEGEA
jgi:hypothetical protein